MYDKCYFCLDQLPKLKKESTWEEPGYKRADLHYCNSDEMVNVMLLKGEAEES